MITKVTVMLQAGLISCNLLAAESIRRPNILLIITDQQNSTALSCAGNPYVKTPALDGLAARGVRFARSYCTYPLCSPSRASQFTSRMPHEVGINSNRKPDLSPDVLGMGKVFRDAGYETAWTGKWHLPALFPAVAQEGRRTIPGFEVLPMQLTQPLPENGGDEGRGIVADPAATRAAVEFLKAPRTKPFLLVVSLLNPHDIVGYKMNPKPFQKMAQSVSPPPVPVNFNATQQEPEVVEANRSRPGWTESDWRLFRSTYYRLMEICDGHIGQILEALRGAGLADNTIVIATSDHGECMGAHHLTSKEQLYEEAVAVPLIVTTPATSTAGGGKVDAQHLVSGLDLLPTMCDYAGIAVPSSFRGMSLRPLVENRPVLWRDYLVAELADNRDARMVRTARYKYIVFAAGKNREQLFDMETDPGEAKNLAGNQELQPVLDEHRRLLQQWLKETQDPFVSSDKPLNPKKGGARKAKASKNQ